MTGTILLLAALLQEGEGAAAKEAPYHSAREGARVELRLDSRAGPVVLVPSSWVEWHEKFDNSLHCSREELDRLRNPEGEWDREFAALVDPLLPFQRCGFHGGDDGWGEDSCAYSDMQMRMYVVRDGLAGLQLRIRQEGAKQLARILAPSQVARRNAMGTFGAAWKEHANEEVDDPEPTAEYLATLEPEEGRFEEWHLQDFAFPLYFGDYGATAQVCFAVRRFGDRSVVAVFCHTNFRDQRPRLESILRSVEWESPPTDR